MAKSQKQCFLSKNMAKIAKLLRGLYRDSVSHLLHALEEFNHLGIRFISVQDQVDTQSPMGKAMFTIIGAMTELESSLISERVKAGMAAAKNRGKKIGRPQTPSYIWLIRLKNSQKQRT